MALALFGPRRYQRGRPWWPRSDDGQVGRRHPRAHSGRGGGGARLRGAPGPLRAVPAVLGGEGAQRPAGALLRLARAVGLPRLRGRGQRDGAPSCAGQRARAGPGSVPWRGAEGQGRGRGLGLVRGAHGCARGSGAQAAAAGGPCGGSAAPCARGRGRGAVAGRWPGERRRGGRGVAARARGARGRRR